MRETFQDNSPLNFQYYFKEQLKTGAPLNPNNHLRHNSCNLDPQTMALMKQYISKPKIQEVKKDKELFRCSYRFQGDNQMKPQMQRPSVPTFDNNPFPNKNSLNSPEMLLNKAKSNESNFPIIAQSHVRTNSLNSKENLFHKTTAGGFFPMEAMIMKMNKINKNTIEGKGKQIEKLEENNDSFLNEVADLLVDFPVKNIKAECKKIEEKEETENNNGEVDPRINFEKINELNKQRPLTSYGGLMARKRSLQNSLRQQSSKTRCDSNNINQDNNNSCHEA